MLHHSLRNLQCTEGMNELQTASQDKRFRLDFSESSNAGIVLDHASQVIKRHLGSKQRFKIGFTHKPHSRFYKRYEDLWWAF